MNETRVCMFAFMLKQMFELIFTLSETRRGKQNWQRKISHSELEIVERRHIEPRRVHDGRRRRRRRR